MRLTLKFLVASGALALAACSGPADGDGLDAGAGAMDATIVEMDASEDFDAGEDVDSGVVVVPDPDDGGVTAMDAGMSDAGTTTRRDAGPPPPPPPTAVERTFRVLHWNIAGGKENDCQTAGITRAVRRFVADRNVDFVGLNEVCPSQYASIEAALREHWGLGARRQFSAYVGDVTGRVVGNAIYSRLGLENVTRLRVGEDMYGERNLICGQVPDLPHLRFCGTHLTPGDSAARTQMGRVLTRIEDWWANRRDTVILTGDLNLHPNDSGLNSVYTSAATTRNNPDNRGHYHELDDADPDHCPGYGEGSVPGSGGPCNDGGKIDFIFVRANRIVDDRYSGDTMTVPSDCTGACSDHRPVFGRAHVRIRL